MNLEKIENFFQNKYVLYVIFFFSIVNILAYLSLNDFGSISLFILVAILTNFFNKNMGIILLVALFVTNLVLSKNYLNQIQESFKLKKNLINKENFQQPEDDIRNVSDMYGNDGNYTESNESDLTDKKHSIDYAATFNKSFSDLEKNIGTDGIEGLTNETQQLIDKQKKLINNVKSLQPFLKKAENFLDRFNDEPN